MSLPFSPRTGKSWVKFEDYRRRTHISEDTDRPLVWDACGADSGCSGVCRVRGGAMSGPAAEAPPVRISWKACGAEPRACVLVRAPTQGHRPNRTRAVTGSMLPFLPAGGSHPLDLHQGRQSRGHPASQGTGPVSVDADPRQRGWPGAAGGYQDQAHASGHRSHVVRVFPLPIRSTCRQRRPVSDCRALVCSPYHASPRHLGRSAC